MWFTVLIDNVRCIEVNTDEGKALYEFTNPTTKETSVRWIEQSHVDSGPERAGETGTLELGFRYAKREGLIK